MRVVCGALLAHQGGWDEALLIAGPILAIAGLLILAKRRVDAAAASAAVSESTETTEPATEAPEPESTETTEPATEAPEPTG